MIGSVGDEVLTCKHVHLENSVLPPSTKGVLLSIGGNCCNVSFGKLGSAVIPTDYLRQKSFAVGDSVIVRNEISAGGIPIKGDTGVVIGVIANNKKYLYLVRLDTRRLDTYLEAYHLCTHKQEVPMVISELAKHMINVGGGVNPNTVPPWFTSVVKALGNIPKLSEMEPEQMEYIIKNHMSNRVVNTPTDLVANVLFTLQSYPTPELRKMEERLYGFKASLEKEWKALDKIVPIEFQYAALKAYAEYK